VAIVGPTTRGSGRPTLKVLPGSDWAALWPREFNQSEVTVNPFEATAPVPYRLLLLAVCRIACGTCTPKHGRTPPLAWHLLVCSCSVGISGGIRAATGVVASSHVCTAPFTFPHHHSPLFGHGSIPIRRGGVPPHYPLV